MDGALGSDAIDFDTDDGSCPCVSGFAGSGRVGLSAPSGSSRTVSAARLNSLKLSGERMMEGVDVSVDSPWDVVDCSSEGISVDTTDSSVIRESRPYDSAPKVPVLSSSSETSAVVI